MFATASMPFSAMIMTEMTDMILLDSGRIMNGTMAALKGFSNKAGIAAANAAVSFYTCCNWIYCQCCRKRTAGCNKWYYSSQICSSGCLRNCYYIGVVQISSDRGKKEEKSESCMKKDRRNS